MPPIQLPSSLLRQGIQRGAILHADIFPNIDHGKFFVIMGIDANQVAGFFFINSKINAYVAQKPLLHQMQHLMPCAAYPFLNYDSYLSATDVKTIALNDLAQHMANHSAKIVGRMRDEDLTTLLDKVKNSPLFSPKEIKQFFS